MRMPSKKAYKNLDLDEYDSRVALYSEEAFQQGIQFNAKVSPPSHLRHCSLDLLLACRARGERGQLDVSY